jgi:hypothetical protein
MMTRKDFEAIAKAVRNATDEAVACEMGDELTGINMVVRHLAIMCAESNERFDKDRFLRACM